VVAGSSQVVTMTTPTDASVVTGIAVTVHT